MRTEFFKKISFVCCSFSVVFVHAPQSGARPSVDYHRMQKVVDGTLAFIERQIPTRGLASLKRPQKKCLRGVKTGFYSAGLLKKYPAWQLASQMDKILGNPKKLKKYLKGEYKFVELSSVKSVKDAPPYSILIYEGAPYGHIEIKVPADHLIEKGYKFALRSLSGKEVKVSLLQLHYVYISDYIDAFPRNHQASRVANMRPDNKRPLKAVFQLQRI